MEQIVYVDKNNKKYTFDYNNFYSFSWIADFDFVLKQSELIKEQQYYLFKQLILRSTGSEDRNKIKNTSYYEEMKNRILIEEDILLKAKFIILFEPSQLKEINIKDLIYGLLDLTMDNELIKYDIISLLVDLSSYVYDFDLQRFIMSQINYLCNGEYDEPKIYGKYLY